MADTGLLLLHAEEEIICLLLLLRRKRWNVRPFTFIHYQSSVGSPLKSSNQTWDFDTRFLLFSSVQCVKISEVHDT